MRDLAPLAAHEGCGGCLGGRVREDGPGVTVYSLPFPLDHLKTDLFRFSVTVVHFILSLCPVSLPRLSRMPAFSLIFSDSLSFFCSTQHFVASNLIPTVLKLCVLRPQ